MLRRMRIDRFRKHVGRRLEFGRITAIVGPNGVGKSSILDAIEMVFYPDLFHTVSHNVRKGSPGAKIQLEMEVNGGLLRFDLLLNLKGKKITYSIRWENGGKLEELLPDEARRLAGLPGSLESFRTLYYIRQGSLGESPKRIAEVVRRSLGIDSIKELLDILTETLRDYSKEQDRIRDNLPLIDDHFKDAGKVEIGDVDRRINHLLHRKRRIETELTCLKRARGRWERLEREITDNLREMERLERELQDKVERKRELEGKLKALSEQIERLKGEMGKMDVKVEEGVSLKDVEDKLSKVGRDKDRVNEILGAIGTLKDHLKLKVEEAKRLKQRLETHLPLLSGKDPEYLRRMRDYARAIEDMRETEEDFNRYKELEGILNGIKGRIERLREVWRWLREMEEIEREMVRVLGEVPDIDGFRENLENLAKEKATLEANLKHELERKLALERGEGTCPVCGRKLEGDMDAILRDIDGEVERIRSRLSKVNAELRKYNFVKGKVERYRSLKVRIEEELGSLDGINVPLNASLQELRAAIEETGRSLKGRAEDVKRELDKLVGKYRKYVGAHDTVERLGGVTVPEDSVEALARVEDGVLEAYGRLINVEGEIRDIRKAKKRREEELNDIKNRYPDAPEDLLKYLDSLRVELERGKEYLKKRSELDEKEKDFKRAKKEIEALGDPESHLAKTRESLKKLREVERGLRERINNLNLYIVSLRNDLEDVKKKLDSLTGYHGRWKTLIEERGMVETMLAKVEEGRGRFTEARKRLFESRVAHYFLRVFGHDVSYSRLELDDELMPILTLHNGERVSVSYGARVGTDQIALSGGEKTALHLSYIMALREIVKDERGEAPILLLDEPTTHLDAERREDVWEIVDELHRSRGIQVILVTHDTDSFQSVLGERPYVRIEQM